MPKWMAASDSFTAGWAMGISALLAGVNPKNLGLTLAAALTIAQAGLYGGRSAVALVLFILIANVSVGLPVLYYLVAGEAAAQTLDSWKA